MVGCCAHLHTLPPSHSSPFPKAEFWDEVTKHDDATHLVRVPAVLALYNSSAPGCSASDLQMLGFNDRNLPADDVNLLLGRFDVAARKAESWYQWDEGFDLAARYVDELATGCPVILFHPRGPNGEALAPIRWHPANAERQNFHDFVMEQLKHAVEVNNVYDRHVDLLWLDGAREHLITTVAPGDHTTIHGFASHHIVGRESKTHAFLNGFTITGSGDVHLVKQNTYPTADIWLAAVKHQEEETRRHIEAMIWSHKRRHLLNVKQVPVVPGYTERGFKKVRMPSELFERIRGWYDLNRDPLRVVENWPKGATQVNFDYVKTEMVTMPNSLKDHVARSVRPLLEEWIGGEPLEYTMMYGARIYHNGSILRNHVDRIETHVVSCIINIDQDVDEDWELEVFDTSSGKRVRVAMQPGDMVFYESSKLIHGRPTPLNGRSYTNAFLHFRPIKGWDWKFTPHNELVSSQQRIPLLPYEVLGTPWVPGAKPTASAPGLVGGAAVSRDEL